MDSRSLKPGPQNHAEGKLQSFEVQQNNQALQKHFAIKCLKRACFPTGHNPKVMGPS